MKFHSFHLRRLLVLAFLCLLSCYAFASATPGIHGHVEDSLDRTLAGATVTLIAPDGHQLAATTSDDAGKFTFPSVDSGTYEITVNKAHFKQGVAIATLQQHEGAIVSVTLASEAALDIKVTTQRLDAARNSISTATGSSTYQITRQAIQALPQGSGTPMNQVLLQAPGVVQDSFGQLHVRGDHGDVQYRLNDILLPESIDGFGQTLDTRFAKSITMDTGALPAQYGYRTAGVVNIYTMDGAFSQGGNVGVTVGSHNTREVDADKSGSSGKFDYYLNGSFLQNDLGIENPTSDYNAVHDQTSQNKGFGYLSYLLNNQTRLSLIGGTANSHFEIPNIPGLSPGYTYAGVPNYPSTNINDSQQESTHYGILALQGMAGDKLSYQVALFSRYSSVNYSPDTVGDLMYTGVASAASRTALANGLQADSSYILNDAHTLRTGLFISRESLENNNDISTFPADSAGNQTSNSPIHFTDNSAKLAFLYSAYVQDEWKATQKLTLNYGLRFDQIDAYVSGNQVSPRLGAVYQLTPATTLHAGYARYFTPPPTELISEKTVSLFANTTNAAPSSQNDPVQPEKTDYFDVGIGHELTPHLTLGIDTYYKHVNNLLDEGQFGSAILYTPFNYRRGKIYGVELTANYKNGGLSAYANLARSAAYGENIVSNQYQIDGGDLAYIENHWIHLDHDQAVTASTGVSYLWRGSTYSVDGIFGSGLRRDGDVPNGDRMPSYAQINTGIAHTFNTAELGKFEGRFSIINLFDRQYELRDGTGIGVGAPQYGPRRAFYVSLNKPF